MVFSNRYLFYTFLCCVASGSSLPMTKPNGEPDMANVISHVTLLEHTVSNLLTQFHSTTNDLNIVNEKLQVTEDKLQMAEDKLKVTEDQLLMADNKSQTAESKLKTVENQLLASANDLTTLQTKQQLTENELTKVQRQLNLAEIEIANLKYDLQKCPDPREVESLRKELDALNVSQIALDQRVNSTSNVSVNADEKSCKNEIHSLKYELLTVQTELNQTILDLQLRQNITEQNLTATRSALRSAETDVKGIQANISTISGHVTGHRQKGEDVAFQVSSKGSREGWTILIFDSVDFNTGGGYDSTAGVFTAPVTGTYIFWANVAFEQHIDDNDVFIHKGNQILARGYFRVNHFNDSGTASAMTVTHLDKGDFVYFTTNSRHSYVFGEKWSSYGGALLHAS